MWSQAGYCVNICQPELLIHLSRSLQYVAVHRVKTEEEEKSPTTSIPGLLSAHELWCIVLPPSLNWIQSWPPWVYWLLCPLWWSLIIWPRACVSRLFSKPLKVLLSSTPWAVSQPNPSRARHTIQFAPFVFQAFLYPKVIEALILFKANHVM